MVYRAKKILIRALDNIVKLKNKARFLIPVTHKRYIKRKFLRQHGYTINFKVPITLTEKIQWLKLYGSLEKYAKYVDKNEVRNYVKEMVGEKYLIPKIGVYENANDINIDLLPKKFIVKATHGSGWNMIVKDKAELDWFKAKERIESWINTNYFYVSGEKNYKNIRGRVIIEQLIEDSAGDMKEYKFYCYHGEPQYTVAVKVTENTRKKGYYDVNWNWLNMNISGLPDTNISVKKPYHYNEMLEISRKLSDGFPFVRVDLYYSHGKIYVGELTFTPNNGFGKFSDFKFDRLFGEPLIIP
ncbi:ATP-grasp fold amidoligase family protein [Virgibacillus salinus]|uniref:TupA-like ATPgrasp n=1 Tax=Virgibacillus salinus TaxID=553311 RepID=A0A1H0Y465_9BACI|nr:ATP-grasp fold amidoligase family protein [Virgibacillus salinus]SDQ09938.1 TupA-like ATPgrasp [Virgibacillus salinus]